MTKRVSTHRAMQMRARKSLREDADTIVHATISLSARFHRDPRRLIEEIMRTCGITPGSLVTEKAIEACDRQAARRVS
jgi:hypothetical protein